MLMAKPSESPGFYSLLREWNQRIHQAGYTDAEVMRGTEFVLTYPGTAKRYLSMDVITRDAKTEYFVRVAKRVAETRFDDDQEGRILRLYAEGYKKAEIGRILGIEGRFRVYAPIYKWLTRWGLK